MELTNRGEIVRLLERHNFSFSKSLGQNFLVNPSVPARMAELCGADRGVGVLEIGPGIGVLTRQLARRAEAVAAVEADGRLPGILAETLAGLDNVSIIHADALRADLADIISRHFKGLRAVVCASLPYNVASAIIMRLLEEQLPVESITVLVQREAAARLCAPLGTRGCGAISGAVEYYSEAERKFLVSPGSFMPAPKVVSQVIQLVVRSEPPVKPDDRQFMFKVIRAAFEQRRKKAANSVSSALGIDRQTVSYAFAAAGIDPSLRAEQLSLEQFCLVSNSLREVINAADTKANGENPKNK